MIILKNEQLILYTFMFLTIITTLLSLLAKNTIHNILFLVLTFVLTSFILFQFELEFLAMIILIVYVGAIAILFLFVVMLLDLKEEKKTKNKKKINIFIITIITLFLAIKINNIVLEFQNIYNLNQITTFLTKNIVLKNINNFYFLSTYNIDLFGLILYNKYYLPFFLSGIILLIAMLGAISLTLEKKNFTKKFKTNFSFKTYSNIKKNIYFKK